MSSKAGQTVKAYLVESLQDLTKRIQNDRQMKIDECLTNLETVLTKARSLRSKNIPIPSLNALEDKLNEIENDTKMQGKDSIVTNSIVSMDKEMQFIKDQLTKIDANFTQVMCYDMM